MVAISNNCVIDGCTLLGYHLEPVYRLSLFLPILVKNWILASMQATRGRAGQNVNVTKLFVAHIVYIISFSGHR